MMDEINIVPISKLYSDTAGVVESANRKPVVITKHSNPVAIILSVREYATTVRLLREVSELKARVSLLEEEGRDNAA